MVLSLLAGHKVLRSVPSRHLTSGANPQQEGRWLVLDDRAREIANNWNSYKTASSLNHRPLVAREEEQELDLSFTNHSGKPSPSRKGTFLNQWSHDETRAQLDRDSFQADASTFTILLRWCSHTKALLEGKRVHENIFGRGLDRGTLLGGLLVQMYLKCGALEDALALLTSVHQQNKSLWNVIIRAYAQRKPIQEAVKVFDQMQNIGGVMADKFTFVLLLTACASQKALREGMKIHACARDTGFDLDVVVATALVNMYGKCGKLEYARRVFDKLLKPDVIAYTAMIGVYAQHGHGKEAFQLFEDMGKGVIKPNRVTFVCVLDAVSSCATLAECERIHAYTLDSGFEPDAFVGAALVKLYGKCGSPDGAKRTFDKVHYRDVILWNAMISVYAQNGKGKEAIQFFKQMHQEGVLVDKVSLVSIFDAFARCAALLEGKRVHACILRCGFEEDIILGTSLVNMYGKCGRLKEAHRLFNNMSNRDVVLWTAMIAVYAQQGHGRKALQLFDQMLQEALMPHKITFISIFDACASCVALAEGKRMHACFLGDGFVSDVVVGTALIHMYGKCGSLEVAQREFERMPEKNIISWNTLIAVNAQHEQVKDALQLFERMPWEAVNPNKVTFISLLNACAGCLALMEGKKMHASIVNRGFEQDLIVGNVLVNMYGKCGSLEDAEIVFDRMPERNVVSWTALIAVYAQHGQGQKALHLFGRMWSDGVKPDKITCICILDACSISAALAQGEQMHACIVNCGIEIDDTIGTALVNMYGRCGSLENARCIFDMLSGQTLILWNAMIAVYSHHGEAKEAFQLFHLMQQEGVMPDKITFVNTYTACSHAGLVEEGHHYFISMVQDHGISPILEHYICTSDLFGRAGRLLEADYLLNHMPFQPTVASFMAVLDACRFQADVKRAEGTASHMAELDPESSMPYLVLLKIYDSARSMDQRWED